MSAELNTEPVLHNLDARSIADHLVTFRPSESVAADILQRAQLRIPSIAKTSDVLRVLRHNPDCMFAIAKKEDFNADKPAGLGFMAMLPLTSSGLEQLALGLLDATNPDLGAICKRGERPAGIYLWCIFAPGEGLPCMALFMEKMSVPPYAGVSMYLRPVTEQGERLAKELGFSSGAVIGAINAPHLWTISCKPS